MELKEGDKVIVQILKNGYFKDLVRGTFKGYTKNGKCRVVLHAIAYDPCVRCFSPYNVRSDESGR